MKRIARILILLSCVIVAIWLALFWYLRAPVFTTADLPELVHSVDAQVLEKHVRFLSELNPPRSFDHPESTAAAEKYIVSEFESMGYKIELQEVPLPNYSYNNIIVRYGEASSEKPLVVIGAHYDVCSHLPGADDNASGVAGLLELARMFQLLKPELSFPVEFVAYALEEPPYFASDDMGSAIHAAHLKESNKNVRLMISIEMIGYYPETAFSQYFPIPVLYALYPNRGDFIAAVARPEERKEIQRLKQAFAAYSETEIYSINAPAFIPGIDFSDHRNYWKYNWPAIMITDTAFFRNLEYHTKGDIADRLNYLKMKEVVEGIYASAIVFAK